ncbi:PAS domain S-box protein [Methylovulum psychrotolerans]|uniref:PAS domain S-box protein n=1 Tax=Methylovulum psychrotolerans TaxID=1704499 RepID=A0A2S5CQK4_9GAMM|nr:PAS domain S-box protein [Methylovulum psychrotolerans]
MPVPNLFWVLSLKSLSVSGGVFLLKSAALAFSYACLAQLMLHFFSPNGVVSVIWPCSGLALGALLIGGKHYGLGVFVGAWLGNSLAGSPPGLAAAIAGGNTLEALMGFYLLNGPLHGDLALRRLRDYLVLVVAAMLSAGVSAMLGCTALVLAGVSAWSGFVANLLHWWQGDMMGMVLITPCLLVWREPPYRWLRRGRLPEIAACFGLAWLFGQSLFLGWFNTLTGPVLSFWMFLFFVWSGMRFGRHGVLLIMLMSVTQSLLGLVWQVGLFGTMAAQAQLVNFWFYTIALSVVGLTLALITRQNADAKRTLELSEEKLRAMFDLSPLGMARNSLDGRFIEANQALLKMVGYSLDELNTLTYWQLTPEQYAPQEIEQLAKLNATGSYGPYQKEYIRHDGHRIVVRLNGVRITGTDGENYIWSTIEDITEQQQAADTLKQEQQLLRTVLDNLPIGIWVVDAHGTVIRGNAAGQQIWAGAEYVGIASYGAYKGWWSATGERVKDEEWAAVRAIRHGETVLEEMIDIECVDGTCKTILNSALPLRDKDQHITGAIVVNQDISERRRNEEAMQLASLVYQNSSEAMMVADEHNIIIAINPAFTQLTGYTAEDIIGKNPNIRSTPLQDPAFYQEMWAQINTTGRWQGEVWNRRKSGEACAERLSVNTIFKPNGSVYRRVALFYDITEKKAADELIWRQANFDPLTGLPNRRMFYERLEQEIKKADHAKSAFVLLFLDLDRFKEVNDSLGHHIGDQLLQDVAQRLKLCVLPVDTVARLGGDEFTVIMGGQGDSSRAETLAQEILEALATPFVLGGDLAYVTASIGIITYPDVAGTTDALLKCADQAMYYAKAQGRNRYSFFDPMMQAAAQRRQHLANDLHSALAEQQLRVVYQPIVQLATGRVVKAEALVRWQHPQLGLVSPSEFIPIAEETGLIITIGEWVFLQAVRQVKHWRENYCRDFQISVNKSPIQFQDKNLHYPAWPEQLKKLGLPGQSIVVEITEGLLLETDRFIDDKFMAFRDAGLQVALDDFGTGYSSLAYLKKFDIDYLKIDQSFVRNLTAQSDDKVLCEAIIVMAHKLGIKVIAEGVETEGQCGLLAAMGCDYGQGYWFSKPVAPEVFEGLFGRAFLGDR